MALWNAVARAALSNALHPAEKIAGLPCKGVRYAPASRLRSGPASDLKSCGRSIERHRFPNSRMGKQTMEQDKTARALFLMLLRLGLSIGVAPVAGCDSSSAVRNIPEESKKGLIQRKVDVTAGKAKSSRTGNSLTNDRASGQKR
jgi:hypothetical protein